MSDQRVEGFQVFQGSLTFKIVFHFLFVTLERLVEPAGAPGRRVVVVLDNSPLSHIVSLINYCIHRRVTLLHTAPRSSIENPIEILFVFLKAPLKRTFSCSKWDYQPPPDATSLFLGRGFFELGGVGATAPKLEVKSTSARFHSKLKAVLRHLTLRLGT